MFDNYVSYMDRGYVFDGLHHPYGQYRVSVQVRLFGNKEWSNSSAVRVARTKEAGDF